MVGRLNLDYWTLLSQLLGLYIVNKARRECLEVRGVLRWRKRRKTSTV